MSAPQWVETVLAAHADCILNDVRTPGSADTGDDVWSCGTRIPFRADLDEAERAHLADVLWAEFTARAQQTREDVAEAVAALFGPSDSPDDAADAAIAALLTAIGGGE